MTTFFHLRALVNTDRAESGIQSVDRLVADLERISFRLLTVNFNADISEDFFKVQKELKVAVGYYSDMSYSEYNFEASEYFSFLSKYFLPHMNKLNGRIADLLRFEEEPGGADISLEERSFYYKLNLYDDIEKAGYFLDLEEAMGEITFLLSDISNVYRDMLDKAKNSLADSRKKAYHSFYISLVLFLIGVFLALTLFIIKRYENARIAEIETRIRNEELEQLVNRRTSDLEKTRNFIVEQEKMAALGGLVAGVAHEVNTPLGIGVTAASFLSEMIREYPVEDLDFSALKDASDLILTNLQRASKLIQGFKRVAVDESGEEVRVFDLVSYLSEDLLPSINHMIHKRGHEVSLEGLDSLVLNRNPGDFAQIVSNLVINASIHGYGSIRPGIIRVIVEKDGKEGRISVMDEGSGMEQKIQKRMYDPFFTTNRKGGGSGLGLMLVYNLVNQKLKGRLICRSAPGEGTDFIIQFPLEV